LTDVKSESKVGKTTYAGAGSAMRPQHCAIKRRGLSAEVCVYRVASSCIAVQRSVATSSHKVICGHTKGLKPDWRGRRTKTRRAPHASPDLTSLHLDAREFSSVSIHLLRLVHGKRTNSQTVDNLPSLT